MAYVFGEMRTLKTGSRRWGAQNLSRLGKAHSGRTRMHAETRHFIIFKSCTFTSQTMRPRHGFKCYY